jgi:hypothetical protein
MPMMWWNIYKDFVKNNNRVVLYNGYIKQKIYVLNNKVYYYINEYKKNEFMI